LARSLKGTCKGQTDGQTDGTDGKTDGMQWISKGELLIMHKAYDVVKITAKQNIGYF